MAGHEGLSKKKKKKKHRKFKFRVGRVTGNTEFFFLRLIKVPSGTVVVTLQFLTKNLFKKNFNLRIGKYNVNAQNYPSFHFNFK